jgi:ABC-type glutathione transport system ATPase component
MIADSAASRSAELAMAGHMASNTTRYRALDAPLRLHRRSERKCEQTGSGKDGFHDSSPLECDLHEATKRDAQGTSGMKDRAGVDLRDAAPLIQVENVAKRYESHSGESINAIEQISLDIPSGGFISLVGPSGCGKSTLLKMIGRLLPPSSGLIRYRNIPEDEVRPRLGVGV